MYSTLARVRLLLRLKDLSAQVSLRLTLALRLTRQSTPEALTLAAFCALA